MSRGRPRGSASHRRRGRRDEGQSATELMGLVVVVAIIVAGLAAGSFSTQIADGIKAAVCKIYGGSCSIESEEHIPETECETMSESGEVDGDVVVFSVDVGGDAKYTLSRAVDPDGKVHWYVTLQGDAHAGADVMFGEEAHLGDLGEGGEAEIKALLTGGAGTKYEFENEKDARGFITDSEHEAVKQAILPSWSDPFGWGHDLMNKIDGHSWNPPKPTEYFYEGGGQIDGSADFTEGAAKVGVDASGTAVVGVKVDPANGEHGDEKTVYVKISSEAAAKLGVFDTASGQLGDEDEVVVGLTYDDKGQPIKASLEAAGTLKGQFGLTPTGGKTKLGEIAGFDPEATPEGGLSVGGGEKAVASFELDLTKGNNLNVFADGLHSIGVPLLQKNGSANPPDPWNGIKGVYDLFDNGADGTTMTVAAYSETSNDNDLSVKGGDVLAFGVEGGLKFENEQIQSGAYYSPGNGFVKWEACSK
jgi:hypothetical protein